MEKISNERIGTVFDTPSGGGREGTWGWLFNPLPIDRLIHPDRNVGSGVFFYYMMMIAIDITSYHQ